MTATAQNSILDPIEPKPTQSKQIHRVSNSFSYNEARLMKEMAMRIANGGDLAPCRRSPYFPRLAKKMLAMAKKVRP